MKIRLIFEKKEDNITFENKVDSFEDIVDVIAKSNWYGLNNKMYVNVSKIVRIEKVE